MHMDGGLSATEPGAILVAPEAPLAPTSLTASPGKTMERLTWSCYGWVNPGVGGRRVGASRPCSLPRPTLWVQAIPFQKRTSCGRGDGSWYQPGGVPGGRAGRGSIARRTIAAKPLSALMMLTRCQPSTSRSLTVAIMSLLPWKIAYSHASTPAP